MWRTITRPSARRRDERGYTLTEFSVAMGVFLIFITIATPFMFRQLGLAIDTQAEIDVQQNARSALRTMVRELRQAGGLYATPAQPTSRNAISFAVDLDADAQIEATEQVTYYVGGGALLRGRDTSSGVPLASGVSSVAFTLFGSNPTLDVNDDGTVTETELNTNGNTDGAGNPRWEAGELANVTRVRIAITVGSGDSAQTHAAEAWLRNRVVG